MRIGLDISVLNEPQRTGIAVYVYQLVKALLKVNSKDQFILFAFTPLASYHYMKNLEFKNYPNVEMKIFRMPSKVFRSVFILWQKMRFPPIESFIGNVDIFHSFNWFIPPQKSGKVVAHIFDLTSTTHLEWHHPRTTQLDKIRFAKIKTEADLVIAISENSKKDFLKYSPKSKVEVVYPAVSENLHRVNNKQIEKTIKKYNLKPGYMLSVATLEPRKNISSLIKAYLKTDLKIPLVLVGGSGWKNQQILDLIRKNPDKIKMTGFVPDEELPAFYKAALCFVYPSLYEGFGIPVLEAMSLGVPVICSKTSSLPEVGGKAVYYINPDNIDSISEAMMELITDQMLRKKMIKQGLKQSKKFSWQKSAQNLIKLYHQLS